jgi:uncharacterized protein YndB with AHSA1/START domain
MADIEHINYIKVPAAIVYETLTTQKGLAEVWTNKLVVKPQIGFVNEFDFDDNYGTKMKIAELEENKRIVWDCIESDPEWVGTKITFDLSEKNGVTSIILRQLNWRAVTEFFMACNYNWAIFLLSLKQYCEEGKGLPYQQRTF